jgi:hypothetical protein
MQLYVVFDPITHVASLNYMWMPTWLGLNAELLADMEKQLAEKFVGCVCDDKTLLAMHCTVKMFLRERFPELASAFPGNGDEH